MIPPEQQEIPPAPDQPFWTWTDAVWFLCSLPLAAVVSVVVVFAANGFWGSGMSLAERALAIQGVLYVLVFGSLWFILHLRHHMSLWPALRLPVDRDRVGMLLLTGIGLAFGIVALGAVLRVPQVDNPMLRLLKDPFSILLVGVFASTLGPAAEEALFRGFLQPLIEKTAGLTTAILSTSLLFAALHGQQYAWSWRHLVLLLLASIVFGLTRARLNSTGASTLVHAAYNMTTFLGFVIQGRTLPPHG